MEGTLSFHGKAPSKDEVIKAHTELDIARKRIAMRRDAAPAMEAST
jgi:hypothetical protein